MITPVPDTHVVTLVFIRVTSENLPLARKKFPGVSNAEALRLKMQEELQEQCCDSETFCILKVEAGDSMVVLDETTGVYHEQPVP